MNNPVEQTKSVIDRVVEYIDSSPWRIQYLVQLKSLKAQAEEPCVLAIGGRVKAGKSSFLNALLGRDLAKVGISETTATINYFRYGTPPDPEHPVLIVWENGKESYESKDFLDSLQGNTEEILQKASGIKRIEFLVPDPILKEVTLVDTPGTDAIVGKDKDGHEKVIDTFFHLREKHDKETRELTTSADAVIYLTGSVANVRGQQFIQDFRSAIKSGSSAMNAIGVMAKIDLEDDILLHREELAESIAIKLKHELNTVVPVSAGLWRAVDRLKAEGKLEWMRNKLKQIPESMFDFLTDMEEQFFCDADITATLWEGSGLRPLTIEERRTLLGDLDWRVFVVIARYLYRNSLEEAIRLLVDLSGMEQLKEILRKHFFERGRLLRCFRIVNDLYRILDDLERSRLYETEKEVRSRSDFESFIASHPQGGQNREIAAKLLAFVDANLKTEKELAILKDKLQNELRPQIESLQLKLQAADDHFCALGLIDKNSDQFTEEEKHELYILFGMYAGSNHENDSMYYSQRQRYWIMEQHLSRDQDRKKVAQLAITAYGCLDV